MGGDFSDGSDISDISDDSDDSDDSDFLDFSDFSGISDISDDSEVSEKYVVSDLKSVNFLYFRIAVVVEQDLTVVVALFAHHGCTNLA